MNYIYNRREYCISQFIEEEKMEPYCTSSKDSGNTTLLNDGMENSKERNSLE